MSSRAFLDTQVGTYSGLVMGPMMVLFGGYILFQPVEFLVGGGIPHWLPGVVIVLYGVWRTVRAVRGLLRRRDPDAEDDATAHPRELSRTAQAVANATKHTPAEQDASAPKH